MELIERATGARQLLRRKRLEGRMQGATLESERLRSENRSLREESRRERTQVDRLLDLLQRSVEVADDRPHRMRAALLATVAAGGAYVMGAKAGRSRYDQVVVWSRRLGSIGIRRLAEARAELSKVDVDDVVTPVSSPHVVPRTIAGSARL